MFLSETPVSDHALTPVGSRSFISGVCAAAPPRPTAQHHAAEHTDAENVDPAWAEVEKLRVEQRAGDVLNDHAGSDPGCHSFPTKQEQMGDPHRPKQAGAHETKLERNRERLIVRIVGDRVLQARIRGRRLAEYRAGGTCAMPDQRRTGNESERVLPPIEAVA